MRNGLTLIITRNNERLVILFYILFIIHHLEMVMLNLKHIRREISFDNFE